MPISHGRLQRQTGWSPEELQGKAVLDVGCGSDRFAEVALSWEQMPIRKLIGRLQRIRRKLRYAIPVANYEGEYALSKSQLREFAILDIFDMLAPVYDQPQSAPTLRG